MSEETTDTSNGLADGAEPSMEDILASIRKIIADDEGGTEPLELQNELKTDVIDAGIVSNLDALPKIEPDNHIETLDLDIMADVEPSDSEIDALIADMDMIEAEVVTTPVAGEIIEEATEDPIDLEIPDETKLETSQDIDDNVTSDDELSALLDDMLNGAEDEVAEFDGIAEIDEGIEKLELVVDPAQDLISEDLVSDVHDDDEIEDDDESEFETELDSEVSNSESDMDLVKSLMADLTGEPLHDEPVDLEDDNSEVEEDIFDALGLDVEEPDQYSSPAPSMNLDVNTDDVMDEILSLTLDDEIEIQDNALEASGVEVPVSLKDIAAQAEADADAMSGDKAIAAVAALGAVAATQVGSADEEHEDEHLELAAEADGDDIDGALSILDDMLGTETDINIEAETEADIEKQIDLTPDEETTPMPRAAKKDAIIDEVTESATADVFSSLNKVVEEKAVIAERGDRIGDLVQEALRPMLKDWLDANLKGIVERAVTKEVKRISSGK